MECPVCGERLREIERYGTTIDLCPGCKGCWLDRGKLEKIAEAGAKDPRVVPLSGNADDRADHQQDHDDDDHDRHDGDRGDREGGGGQGKPKKRSSLLGDLLGGLGGD